MTVGVHRTDAEVIREHNSTFLRWFKERVLANSPEEGCLDGTLIYALAHGPSTNLVTYLTYDINGYTFYTEKKDINSDDQNSGVTMEVMTWNVIERYYGRV